MALTPADFDFKKGTVSINKSYQRLNGRDVITTPKTEKSNRIITMPQFLIEEIQDYLRQLYDVGMDERTVELLGQCADVGYAAVMCGRLPNRLEPVEEDPVKVPAIDLGVYDALCGKGAAAS